MKETQIIPTAEPFLLPGDRTSVVLVHGFTGAPKEMRLLGEALNQKGLTVLGVRLAGHATRPEDMARSRWWDWLASVEDGINLLANSCDRIFYAGLSLGGVLSLIAAARIPPAGVIAMSTPFAVDARVRYARLFKYFLPWIKKEKKNGQVELSYQDHVEYPAYSASALAELYDAIQAMRQSLSRVTVPVLLINSKTDPTVPIEHASRIRALLVNSPVQQVLLERSGHVITEDVERETVFEAAGQFINLHSGKK